MVLTGFKKLKFVFVFFISVLAFGIMVLIHKAADARAVEGGKLVVFDLKHSFAKHQVQISTELRKYLLVKKLSFLAYHLSHKHFSVRAVQLYVIRPHFLYYKLFSI